MMLWRALGIAILLYSSYFLLKLLSNWLKARKTGLPVVVIPAAQDNPIWMIVCIPLRPLLKRFLPEDLFLRLGATMHGWENDLKLEPYEKWSIPYGSPKSLVLAGAGRVEVSTWDHEMIAEVLRRPKDFIQFDIANFLLNRFGPNVLSTDGEVWARHRKIVASTLNEKISKIVFDQSINLAEGMISEIFEKSEPSSDCAETNCIFDLIKKLTITVLVNAGMGGNQAWKDPTVKNVKPGFKLTYIEAVKAVIGNLVAAAILPRWFTSWYPPFLPGYETMKLLSYAVGEFRDHIADLINEEKERSTEREGVARNNILSMLLSSSKQEEAAATGSGDQTKTSLSDEEIMGNIFIFTSAGFDSTANTLAYALVYLVQNPQYQDWVFEEIKSLIPSDSEEPLEYTTIFPKALRCLSVMLETLRLHPPLAHLGKMTEAPQVIRTSRSDVYVPTGSTIYINSVVVHLDPDIWRDINRSESDRVTDMNATGLPDEYTFRPSRWIIDPTDGENSQAKIFQPPKGAFIPWSMGPRVCPGQKMAQVEFVAIFLVLFRTYRLEAVKIRVKDGPGKEREETDEELHQRIVLLIKKSVSKITQEMDVYNMVDGDYSRGLGFRLVRRHD
ncbi:hypothetical protein TWF730_004865 [Orbilia blumenaviensis]|uniref:Cytochrome P450 n=1 Tax=Orbilia blumenaviensis TaxID=1796055 RepID=A0AAV9VHP9_9PEZI